jgi:hypothetical protein
LKEARQTLKAGTSFNIVANGATELSWSDFSAEVELQRREGEVHVRRGASSDARYLQRKARRDARISQSPLEAPLADLLPDARAVRTDL